MPRMVATPEELGERLGRARRCAGLSRADLAQQVSLHVGAIEAIECGQRAVDVLELERIARALARPVDWFIVLPPPHVVSRRATLDVTGERAADVELERLARDAELLVELKLLSLPDPVRPTFAVSSLEDAERAAAFVRGQLGQPDGVVRDLARVAERAGLITASIDLHDDAIDGSYLALEQGGVALINGGRPSGRRRFTLAHELGHHVLADAYSGEWLVGDGGEERERLVNAFAIHLLLPRQAVVADWTRLFGPDHARGAAITLGANHGVSWTALCGQLCHLRLVDEEQRAQLIGAPPRKADYLERGLAIEEDLAPPSLSPRLAAAVIKGYRAHKLSAERALQLLRGTLIPADLPDRHPPTACHHRRCCCGRSRGANRAAGTCVSSR